MDKLSAASDFQFGRSIQSAYHQSRVDGIHIRPDSVQINAERYSLMPVSRVYSSYFDQISKKPTGKDKKKIEEEKKRREEEEA